jgi:hypothetical protein
VIAQRRLGTQASLTRLLSAGDRHTARERFGDASIALLAGTRRVVATHAIARRTGPASLSGPASRTHRSSARYARGAGLTGDNQAVGEVSEWLKRSVRKEPKGSARGRRSRRRRDSDYSRMLGTEIDRASPERAGELARHPIERRDT